MRVKSSRELKHRVKVVKAGFDTLFSCPCGWSLVEFGLSRGEAEFIRHMHNDAPTELWKATVVAARSFRKESQIVGHYYGHGGFTLCHKATGSRFLDVNVPTGVCKNCQAAWLKKCREGAQ